MKALETTLRALREELTEIEKDGRVAPLQIHPGWLVAKLERIEDLVRQDPVRARAEDGDLLIWPKPSEAGEHRAEIVGRLKANSLLRDQEAVCLQLVAGAGFEPATFGPCAQRMEHWLPCRAPTTDGP